MYVLFVRSPFLSKSIVDKISQDTNKQACYQTSLMMDSAKNRLLQPCCKSEQNDDSVDAYSVGFYSLKQGLISSYI